LEQPIHAWKQAGLNGNVFVVKVQKLLKAGWEILMIRAEPERQLDQRPGAVRHAGANQVLFQCLQSIELALEIHHPYKVRSGIQQGPVQVEQDGFNRSHGASRSVIQVWWHELSSSHLHQNPVYSVW